MVDALGFPPARTTCAHASLTHVAACALHRLTERTMATPRAVEVAAVYHKGGASVARIRGTPRPAGRPGGQAMLAITVHHNDVEFALRRLKRQLQQSGLLRELRRRRQYEKPSERRRRQKRAGIRNTRKRERLAHG